MNRLPFRALYEDWAEADLDGISVRFRATLVGLLEDGPGKAQMRFQPQFQVFAPEDRQRAPRPQSKRLGAVANVVSARAASSYEHAGGVVKLYATVVKAFRTDGYDGNGEPIFELEFQQEVQMMGGQQNPTVAPPTPA